MSSFESSSLVLSLNSFFSSKGEHITSAVIHGMTDGSHVRQSLMASTMAGQADNCQPSFVSSGLLACPLLILPMSQCLLETRSACFWKTPKARAWASAHPSVHIGWVCRMQAL